MLPWILSMEMRSNNHMPGKQASSEKLQAFPLFFEVVTSFLYLKLQTKVTRSPNIQGGSCSPHLPKAPPARTQGPCILDVNFPKTMCLPSKWTTARAMASILQPRSMQSFSTAQHTHTQHVSNGCNFPLHIEN